MRVLQTRHAGADPAWRTIFNTQRGHRSTAGSCLAKAEMPVQLRLAAPFHAYVADPERCLSCKQVDVGASAMRDSAKSCGAEQWMHSRRSGNPTGGSISTFPSWCNSSISRCERDGAGAEPAEGTIYQSCARRRSRASGLQVHLTRCESGAHVHFASEV